MSATPSSNKRSLEEQTGFVDQLVKDMNDTGITRAAAAPLQQKLGSSSSSSSTIDFLKRNSLYGYGSSNSSSSNGPVLDNVHSIFAAGLERRRREAYCLGYGGEKTTAATTTAAGGEPPNKRRRFQRRNSKTPAMLFSAMKMPQELFDTEDDDGSKKQKKTPTEVFANASAPRGDDDEDWDGGLEIAEQLVKQLQKRRLSDASSVTAH